MQGSPCRLCGSRSLDREARLLGPRGLPAELYTGNSSSSLESSRKSAFLFRNLVKVIVSAGDFFARVICCDSTAAGPVEPATVRDPPCPAILAAGSSATPNKPGSFSGHRPCQEELIYKICPGKINSLAQKFPCFPFNSRKMRTWGDALKSPVPLGVLVPLRRHGLIEIRIRTARRCPLRIRLRLGRAMTGCEEGSGREH